MNLEKIARECNVSQRKLRLIVKTLRHYGHMPAQDKVVEIDKMRAYLGQGQSLSVEQFVDLIERPELIKALGSRSQTARMLVASLDNPKENPAPRTASIAMQIAAGGDPAMLQQLVDWIKATVPIGGCTYHYLVLRLYYGGVEDEREAILRKASRAFMLVRKQPELAGWFTVRTVNKRSVTFYHRPN